MHLRFLPPVLAAAVLALQQLPAQDAAAAEEQLRAQAVLVFHAQADALEAARMYGRALEARKELLLEYAADDPTARQKAGFIRVGQFWRRDHDALVLDRDSGDPKAVRRIDQDWERTCKDLAKRHTAVAERFAAAGDGDAAARHWRRVLRFRPGDPQAVQQLGLRPFEHFFGTERELLMLRRSRAIRDGVAFLTAWEPAVELLPEGRHPILERASVGHFGVRTRHFEFWGSIAEADLIAAVQWAERCLLLCRTVFAGLDGAIFQPHGIKRALFVPDKESYGRVLDACADQFSPDRLQFLKESVQLAFLKDRRDEVRCYLVASQEETLDQTVRGVVQDAVHYEAHGLWEGIGHAFCGFCFGQTLTFLLEQQTARTVSEWRPRPLVPDLAVWMQIAAETAWSKADTPTSRLVLLHGSRFTTEERVKAWAMVDWLLRWRPDLVFRLEGSRTQATKTSAEVEALFSRLTQMDLPKLDAEWRDYWARSEPLRTAMKAPHLGEEEDVAQARELTDAVNAARALADIGPLGFYLADSRASTAVHRWFDGLVRAEAERKRARRGVEVKDPDPPGELGRAVLGLRGADPARAVATWMQMPAARDALLHPGRTLLGTSRSRHGFVIDLEEPETAMTAGPPLCWPANGQVAVAAQVRAADLGPAVAAVLAERGIAPDTAVGMPLSLHFFRVLEPGLVSEVSCRVIIEGQEIAGIPFCVQGEGDRTQAAPGCCVFVPSAPLPRSATVTVYWEVPRTLRPDKARFAPASFTVEGAR